MGEEGRSEEGRGGGGGGSDRYEEEEERRLVRTLRSSLADAEFEPMTQRDLDLCEALYTGYLLCPPITPKLKNLDPRVGREFYPEAFPDDAGNGDGNGNDDGDLVYCGLEGESGSGRGGIIRRVATPTEGDNDGATTGDADVVAVAREALSSSERSPSPPPV